MSQILFNVYNVVAPIVAPLQIEKIGWLSLLNWLFNTLCLVFNMGHKFRYSVPLKCQINELGSRGHCIIKHRSPSVLSSKHLWWRIQGNSAYLAFVAKHTLEESWLDVCIRTWSGFVASRWAFRILLVLILTMHQWWICVGMPYVRNNWNSAVGFMCLRTVCLFRSGQEVASVAFFFCLFFGPPPSPRQLWFTWDHVSGLNFNFECKPSQSEKSSWSSCFKIASSKNFMHKQRVLMNMLEAFGAAFIQ